MPPEPFRSSSTPGNAQSVSTGNRPMASGEQDLRLLSAIVNASDDAILSKTLDGIITTWNPAAESMFGYSAEEMIGKPKTILFRPEDLQEEEVILDQLRRGISIDHFETVRLHKNGTPVHVSITISPIKDGDGKVIGASTIARDITERKRQEDEAGASSRKLIMVLESSPDCMTLLDTQGRLVYFNEGGKRLVEIEVSTPVQGLDWLSFWEGDVHPLACQALENAFAGRVGRFQGFCATAKGTPMWWDVIVSPLLDEAGQVIQIISVARDITENHSLGVELRERMAQIVAQNAVLEAMATTDGLTGIKNHRALHERLREEYDRSRRYGIPLSAVMLDVDKFKEYNDAFGHPAGDTVLRQVAQILRETVRPCDFVARYGGEEFALLLPGTDVEESKIIAERCLHAIEAAPWPERAVTVSIGVATLTPSTPHPDALLINADSALYRSKHRGRNCMTHTTDPVEAEALDIEAAQWYDGLLLKLLAAQAEIFGSSSDQVRETLLQAYDATVISWSRILDYRDKETDGHSERVAEMMVNLAEHLGLNEQEMLFARWGARLHDIGKIAIPDRILHKPGPLTVVEWVIMRQHTTIAYEMLLPIEFLGSAIDIPYCHHEKWDGSGYPRGLVGEDIPQIARLFAVVDVYDALTSDRPYRKAWPEETVRAYLREQAGTHFDPRAVDAFLSMMEKDCAERKAA